MTWSRDGRVAEFRGLYDSKYMIGNSIALLSTNETIRFLLLEAAHPYLSSCKVLLSCGKVGWLWSDYIEEATE